MTLTVGTGHGSACHDARERGSVRVGSTMIVLSVAPWRNSAESGGRVGCFWRCPRGELCCVRRRVVRRRTAHFVSTHERFWSAQSRRARFFGVSVLLLLVVLFLRVFHACFASHLSCGGSPVVRSWVVCRYKNTLCRALKIGYSWWLCCVLSHYRRRSLLFHDMFASPQADAMFLATHAVGDTRSCVYLTYR